MSQRYDHAAHAWAWTDRHTCQCCGKQFTGRPDARTCSNKCRQKLYRQRKRDEEAGYPSQYKSLPGQGNLID